MKLDTQALITAAMRFPPGTLEKKFILSYAGEAEYEIQGERYTARYCYNPRMPYNGDDVHRYTKAQVGTVMHYSSSKFHTFPPREVVALFPGFVGARYTERFDVVYDGPTPVLFVDPQTGYHMCQTVEDAKQT